MIDAAEDRERFQKLLNDLGLRQPPNRNRTDRRGSRAPRGRDRLSGRRPSLLCAGGAGRWRSSMNRRDLERYMREAVKVSNDSPVLIDRFLNNATEIDVDALSDGQEVIIGGIMQHIEQAGVHSGDSACSLPPYSLTKELQDELRRQTKLMARGLNVCGLMNVQFAIQGKGDEAVVFVLEVNPARLAHRSLRVEGELAAAREGCGTLHGGAGRSRSRASLRRSFRLSTRSRKRFFPVREVPGRDTILGPEMKSTGEVMGVAAASPRLSSRASWLPVFACPPRARPSSASR